MNYQEWAQRVPPEIKGDSVWKSEVYRLALFAADLGWSDATKLLGDKRTISLADQLYRAVGAVSGDVEEGYSRGTGRDRARFYEYALGSAREARGWYFKGRHVLGKAVADHRMRLFTQIIKLLLTMVPDQRGQLLREESPPYESAFDSLAIEPVENPSEILEIVPMP